MTQTVYVPVSDESSLFDGADSAMLATLDVPASIARFDAVLAERIRATYPGATLAPFTRYAADGFGDDATDSQIGEQVQAMAEDLFNDGNLWMIER